MSIVTLYVLAGRFFRSQFSYDSDNNDQSQQCSAQGFVWNTESEFNGKSCTITFIKGKSDDLSDFAKKHGIRSACGSITISGGIKPEKFKHKGKDTSLPPIEIFIRLDDSAYAKAEELLSSSIRSEQEASISLRFNYSISDIEYCSLEDLDISSTSTYPIISCTISNGYLGKNKIEVPRYTYNSENSASLTFTAVNATIETRIRNSEFCVTEIRLDGKLHCTKFDIDYEDNVLEIREYPDYQDFPDESFPGSVFVSKDKEFTHCLPILYATHDTMKNLATLLAGMTKGDTIKFSVSMITDGLPLEIGNHKYFDISSYSPTIIKLFS